MGATDDQALTVHTRKNFKKKQNFHDNNKKDKKPNKTKIDTSNISCYTFDEKGHFERDCPIRKGRHHAHVSNYDEPNNKIFKREKDDSNEEYVLISRLTGTISDKINDRLVDSGSSKHMMRYNESFINMSEHDSPHKVKLWADYQYPIKGSGENSYKLDSEKY